MKRIACLSLLLLAGLVACNRPQEEEATPAKTPAKALLFHASLEGTTSKVYTEDLHVLWNAEDLVSVFAQTTDNKLFRFLGDDGDAEGDFEEVATGTSGNGYDIDYNYAIYPYNPESECFADDYLRADFPMEQTYSANSFGPGANLMVAKSSNMDLSFKNVGGYLCIKLYGEGISVRSIALTGNEDEILSGPVNITFGEGNIPVIVFDDTTPDQLNKKIVLTAETPVALSASEAQATVFWMVVPPVFLSSGFTISVTDDKGGIHTKSTNKPFAFTRNQQMSMKAFELKGSDVPPVVGGDFVLLTDADELTAGDQLLIVNLDGPDYYTLGQQNNNNRSALAVTVTDNTISSDDLPEDAAIVTLEGGVGAWNLAVGEGAYLANKSGNANRLVTVSSITSNATWSISIDTDGEATIEAAAGSRNLLRYNPINAIFSCYSSGQEAVAIYRKSTGPATLVTEYDALGYYLGSTQYLYQSGQDQYLRSYSGDALTFALLNPAENVQAVLTGYSSDMSVDSPVEVVLEWRKGTKTVKSGTYSMTVLKEENGKVWIGDARGYGFIIKK